MADVRVEVRVAAGTRAGGLAATYVVPHQWTDGGIAVEGGGIAVEGGGTGAHLLLTAVACCVLNDVYREAGSVPVEGVVVEAGGLFDGDTWATTSITYDVAVDTPADDAAVARLLKEVDTVAEIPRVVRGEVTVSRR